MVAGGWGGYQNGAIPLAALTNIAGSLYLRADVARQLGRMLDDYGAQTRQPRPLINSAYRSRADQQELLDHPDGQLIAPVGESTHGWAITADLSDTGRKPVTRFSAWLDAHAEKYGFARTIASESWHYQGGGPATIVASFSAIPIAPDAPIAPSPPPMKAAEKMLYLRQNSTGLIVALGSGSIYRFKSPADYSAWVKITAIYNGRVPAQHQQVQPPDDPGAVLGVDDNVFALAINVFTGK